MNQVKLLHLASLAIYSAWQDADMLRQLSNLSYDARNWKRARG